MILFVEFFKYYPMKKIIIAIDGPAGSGKTTTARELARMLNYIYIDTGAMYRAVTLAWLREKTELTDENLCNLMSRISVELNLVNGSQKTFLNGEDVSDAIRLPEVTKFVSPVSAVGCIREKLVDMQRNLGKSGGVVLDGRDIGTVVFPQAELKIFLVASIEARAKRRTAELIEKGIETNSAELSEQLLARDAYDSSRSHSPLRKAEDAIQIDTSDITIEEQTRLVYQMAMEKIHQS